MERIALKVFKEFSLEFATAVDFNKNTARFWFKGQGYHITCSRTIWYEFVDMLDWLKNKDGLSLNTKELLKYFSDDTIYIEKLKKVLK